jgi:hypothetical protein
MRNCAGQKTTSASDATFSCVQFLRKIVWRRRKGHHVLRVPARYSTIGEQHRSQDRPMLSNTSCSALLSPAASAAACLSSPP